MSAATTPPDVTAAVESEAIRLDPVPAAVAALREGRPVVVVDDEDRENEGDLIFPAERADDALLGFTIRYSSGVVCVPMTAQRAAALALPPMIAVNEDPKGTAYTVSCDAARGVSTGISAADRARTARILADPAATAAELTRPGHIFPLVAVDGLLADRAGHTEAAVALCVASGHEPVGVIAELVHDDGSMMRLPALRRFADEHGLVLISIEDLIRHRPDGDGDGDGDGDEDRADRVIRADRADRADRVNRADRADAAPAVSAGADAYPPTGSAGAGRSSTSFTTPTTPSTREDPA